MKKDIKARILEMAKKMFGEQGYNQVSMRNIADAMGISVGNLTYHFKKKEDLIEAALDESHENYRKKPPVHTLEELNGMFRHQLTHYKENAYYFRHYRQLAQLCPRIYALQLSVMRDTFSTLASSFVNFKNGGLLREEELAGQYSGVIRSLMTVMIFGVPPTDGKPDVMNIRTRLTCMWDVIYPMLTDDGKTIYKKSIMPLNESFS